MSRGHGEIQRRVLAELEPYELTIEEARLGIPRDDGWKWFHDLVLDVFDLYDVKDEHGWQVEPTRAQTESVRRAVKSLKREGLVSTSYRAEGVEAIRLIVRLAG